MSEDRRRHTIILGSDRLMPFLAPGRAVIIETDPGGYTPAELEAHVDHIVLASDGAETLPWALRRRPFGLALVPLAGGEARPIPDAVTIICIVVDWWVGGLLLPDKEVRHD